MADKGKKGKVGGPPPAGKAQDTKKADDPKAKTFQPKDEVGTRKGCRRYQWELKDSNKEFWIMGHAEVKILSVVNWSGILGRGSKDRQREEWVPEGPRGGSGVGESSLPCLLAGLPNSCAGHVHRDRGAPPSDTHHHHGTVSLHVLHCCQLLRHPEIHALHPVAHFCK